MLDITTADTYFTYTRHPAADTWHSHPPGARKAALEHAIRILTRALGRPLQTDLPPYAPGDTRRDDFAACEQALHELTAPTPRPAPYAPEALRWLGWSGHTTLKG